VLSTALSVGDIAETDVRTVGVGTMPSLDISDEVADVSVAVAGDATCIDVSLVCRGVSAVAAGVGCNVVVVVAVVAVVGAGVGRRVDIDVGSGVGELVVGLGCGDGRGGDGVGGQIPGPN
jgi:hypothetical protein